MVMEMGTKMFASSNHPRFPPYPRISTDIDFFKCHPLIQENISHLNQANSIIAMHEDYCYIWSPIHQSILIARYLDVIKTDSVVPPENVKVSKH